MPNFNISNAPWRNNLMPTHRRNDDTVWGTFQPCSAAYEMGRYTAEILQNAEKINQLKARLDKTYRHRYENKKIRAEYECVASEFISKYRVLAFPGGLEGADERILAGDPEAMDAAVCFIECRPYFFRSGYMYQSFLRMLKRAPLTADQKTRYERIRTAYKEFRRSRRAQRTQN